jgi:hypothetical protein
MLSTGLAACSQPSATMPVLLHVCSATLAGVRSSVAAIPTRTMAPGVPPASRSIGEWLSLVEHLVRDQGVGGSNPLSPTILSLPLSMI